MFKLFFYWIFQTSKTIKNLFKIHTDNEIKKIVFKIEDSLEINQNRSLRRKWNRITNNENSPFYIYK